MLSNSNEPQVIAGIDSNGNLVPVKVGSDGSLGVSGGGVSGSATEVKQDTQITELQAIKNSLLVSTTLNTQVPNPFPVSSTGATIAANISRKGLTIYNPLSFEIFVGFQSTVSSSSYAVKLFADDYWEVPYKYTGIISIASAGTNTGNILVRELI